MSTTTRQPTLFISHGSPMLALQPGVIGPKLAALGERLGKPKAVLILSPHWMTRGGVGVSNAAHPSIVYDFGGFPAPLYQVKYPDSGAALNGAPLVAQRVAALLAGSGIVNALVPNDGLDHGAWVPLRYLYPDGDVPVLLLSMPADLNAASAYTLGQLLAPLSDEGVLIIGSGSLTHNLSEFTHRDAPDPNAVPIEPYVTQFRAWTHQALSQRDAQALQDYRQLAPHAVRAHPTDEHWLPLPFAMGAARADYALEVVDGGVEYGSFSMDTFVFH